MWGAPAAARQTSKPRHTSQPTSHSNPLRLVCDLAALRNLHDSWHEWAGLGVLHIHCRGHGRESGGGRGQLDFTRVLRGLHDDLRDHGAGKWRNETNAGQQAGEQWQRAQIPQNGTEFLRVGQLTEGHLLRLP